MRSLDNLSSVELAEQLQELDLAIETDQGVVASARKRIKRNYRLRDELLSQLSVKPARRSWA